MAIFIAIIYVKQQQSKPKRLKKYIVNKAVCHKSLHMDETGLLEENDC